MRAVDLLAGLDRDGVAQVLSSVFLNTAGFLPRRAALCIAAERMLRVDEGASAKNGDAYDDSIVDDVIIRVARSTQVQTAEERAVQVVACLHVIDAMAKRLPIDFDPEGAPRLVLRLLQSGRVLEAADKLVIVGVLRSCEAAMQADASTAWWALCEAIEFFVTGLHCEAREATELARSTIQRHSAERGYRFHFCTEAQLSVEDGVEWRKLVAEMHARFARLRRSKA